MRYSDYLRAGDFVELLPIGLPITLKYGANGKLESATKTNGDKGIDGVLYSYIVSNEVVPLKLPTSGGTMFVQGVLELSGDYVRDLGMLPQVIESSKQLPEDLVNGTDSKFLAVSADSTSMNFAGPSLFRSWLHNHGFDCVPGFLSTYGDIEAQVTSVLAGEGRTERDIYGLQIYRGDNVIESRLRNRVDRIEEIQVYLDPAGHVFANIRTKLGLNTNVPYFEVLKLELYEGDYILVSESDQILSKYGIYSAKSGGGDMWYTCPVCGKRYMVAERYAMCPDANCMSRQFERLSHFSSVLGIEPVGYDDYVDAVVSRKITGFGDVLLLDAYKDIEIEASLYKIMDAVIPIVAVPNRESIWQLYSKCNGSYNSIEYYMSHPGTIYSDLGIQDQHLVNWVSEEQNRDDLAAIIGYANVHVSDDCKRFDGSPIFRGKSIAITGRFKHGTHEEVASILRSYSADVRPFDESDCLVVGDIQEDVDGVQVRYMREQNLPVFSESEFFETYDIDNDLLNAQASSTL